MEIKVIIKDGEKSSSFKFSGDPLEVIDGALAKIEKMWDTVKPPADGKPWEPFIKRDV